MISKNEVRIGNVVGFISDPVKLIISELKIKNFYEHGVHVGLGKCFNFNEIYPIPLTEEWLVDKFGFELIEKNGGYSHYAKGINPVTQDYMIILKRNHVGNYIFYLNGYFIIESVHRLQNLYFALTGEELTIKN